MLCFVNLRERCRCCRLVNVQNSSQTSKWKPAKAQQVCWTRELAGGGWHNQLLSCAGANSAELWLNMKSSQQNQVLFPSQVNPCRSPEPFKYNNCRQMIEYRGKIGIHKNQTAKQNWIINYLTMKKGWAEFLMMRWMKWYLLFLLTESSSQEDLKLLYPWVSALWVFLETSDMSLSNSLKGHS